MPKINKGLLDALKLFQGSTVVFLVSVLCAFLLLVFSIFVYENAMWEFSAFSFLATSLVIIARFSNKDTKDAKDFLSLVSLQHSLINKTNIFVGSFEGLFTVTMKIKASGSVVKALNIFFKELEMA